MKRISILAILLFSLILLLDYNPISAQNGQVFAAVKKDGKWGYIDTLGKTCIPFTMESATPFNEGVAAVKYAGKWGYINKKGNFVIKPIMSEAGTFHNNRARITYFDTHDAANYTGYINKYGEMMIILEDFEKGFDYHDGLVKILSKGVFGFKDSTGKFVIEPHYDGATDYNAGFAGVALGNLWGYIDQNNKNVIFPKYNEAWQYQEGLGYVKDGQNTLFLDTAGRIMFSMKYDEVDLVCQDGMICFRDKGKIGFMSNKGKVVIKPTFQGKTLTRFQDGLAPISGENGKTGFIDKTGNFVIAPKFDEAYLFFNNLALVKKGDKYGYIGRDGKWVIEPQFEEATDFQPADTM